MTCRTCNDTGRVVTHRPTMYETDSPAEREDAWLMASRRCPECGGKTQEQQIVALTAERDAERAERERISKAYVDHERWLSTEMHRVEVERDSLEVELGGHKLALASAQQGCATAEAERDAEKARAREADEKAIRAGWDLDTQIADNQRIAAELAEHQEKCRDAKAAWAERYVAAKSERDSLRAALLAVEWGGTTNAGFCPHCEFAKPEHAPDCIVGLALYGVK